MNKRKVILIVLAAVLAVVVLIPAIALIFLQARTSALLDDWSGVLEDEKYQTPVSVEGIEVITQNVSCGYAVIEMFARWNGDEITEETLYEEYGKVVTSTGNAFCDEMNKRFPGYTTTARKYLKNSELIGLVYENLSNGIPVPFEWAAKDRDAWTLHYSLITGIDIPRDQITVANPYGYIEELPIGEFLKRTSFEAYENMPLFLKLGFAFGIFEKNTVFTVETVA